MINLIFNKLQEKKRRTIEALALKTQRKQLDSILQNFYQKNAINNSPYNGPFLVDARWDNPNYWARFTPLRSALIPIGAKEVGFLGPYRRIEQAGTLKNLGISEILDFNEIKNIIKNTNKQKALDIFQTCNTPEKLLKTNLPFSVDPRLMYDCILKSQCLPQVSFQDPNLKLLIEDYLDEISIADYTLNKVNPEVLILGHTIGPNSAIAWLGLTRGMTVLVPFGDNGVAHYLKITSTDKYFDFINRGKFIELNAMSDDQISNLRTTGVNYLNYRFSGKSTNAGATLAHKERREQVTKELLCKKLNWDPQKPIITVYSAVWVDFPHTFGMSNFTDYLDWILSILDVAKKNTQVNWLFKSHPGDVLYGAPSLNSVLEKNNITVSHIALADDTWNGASLIKSIDGVITYHGTVGVEAATYGKPVLIADMGWYHDWPFCIYPKSRQEFLSLLQEKWWEKIDLVSSKKYAEIFTGWHWGRPTWQKNMKYGDDFSKSKLQQSLIHLFTDTDVKNEILKEISEIEVWLKTNKSHYHPFKLSRVQDYLWDAP